MQKMLARSVLFGVLLTGLILSCALVRAVSETPKYGGTNVIAIFGDPAALLPAITTQGNAHYLCGQIYNTLLEYDFDLVTPRPELAQSWEISPDGLTYTFHLVKNATWHDGVPFTSADVKYSFEELIPKYHPMGSLTFASLKQVDTPDPYTAIFRLKYPFEPLIRCFGLFTAGLGAKHIYEGTDPRTNPYSTGQKPPIGTGPFKFVEWLKGDRITLVRNNNYWKKGKPYLDKLIFKVATDSMAAAVALEKGEVTYYPMFVPLGEVERLKKVPGLVVTDKGGEAFNSLALILFNLKIAPYDNVKFRQAFAHAIDKNEYVKKVYRGYASPGIGPFHSQGHARLLNPATNTSVVYKFDRALANKLLDEVGLPRQADGVRLTARIIHNIGDYEASKSCEVLREQLAEVGIKLVLEPTDAPTYSARLWTQAKFELAMFGSQSVVIDPSIGAARTYLTSQIGKGFGTNVMAYSNARLDTLFVDVQRELDEAKRLKMYYEIQEILVRDLPAFTLVEPGGWSGFRTDFVGLPVGPYGSRERQDSVWWTKGSDLSPESIGNVLVNAESEIKRLQGQMYDVSDSMKKLAEARKALEAGEYTKALELSREATRLAQPPYAIYGAVGAIVVVAITGVIYWRRKRAKG